MVSSERIFPVQFFQLTEYNISYLQDHPIDLNMLDPVVENLSNIPNSSLGKLEITPLDDSEPQQQQPPLMKVPLHHHHLALLKVVRKRKHHLGK